MNPNSPLEPEQAPTSQPSYGPASPLSAGDDAAMKAIAALESESNALPVEPLPEEPSSTIQDVQPVAPSPEPISAPAAAQPQPTVPISAPRPEPEPMTAPTQTPPPITSTQPVLTPDFIAPSTPLAPVRTPEEAPTSRPKPSVAQAIQMSLRDDTPAPSDTTGFEPFAHQKKSKKPLIIILVIFVVLLLGAGGYFGWNYLQTQQSTSTPAPAQEATSTPAEEVATPALTDSAASINEVITAINTNLTEIDNSEYGDTTLSDSSLYE